MTDDIRALLRAARAEPSDDGVRLVLADALDDHGDHARAEFVRVQVRRAALPAWHPEQSALARREADLFAAHRRDWLGPIQQFAESVESRRGLLHVALHKDDVNDPKMTAFSGWEWVEGLEYPRACRRPHTFRTPLAEGVNRLRLPELFVPGRTWHPALLPPGLPMARLGPDGVPLLLGLPGLAGLIELDVTDTGIGEAGRDSLWASGRFPCLVSLFA